MRIALVIEYFDPAGGGADRSVAEMARHLRDRGHEVTILCADTPDAPPASCEGIRIEKSGKGKPLLAWGVWRFRRWATRRVYGGSFDVGLDVTGRVPAAIVMPLGGTTKESQRQHVASIASPLARFFRRLAYFFLPRQRLIRWFEWRTFRDRRVKRVIAVSNYLLRMLHEGGRLRRERITMIPAAADVPAVSAEQRAAWRAQVRQGFTVPDDSVAFLFVAANPRLKGIEPLMLAFQKLRERGVKATLLLAGANRFEDQKRAASLGIRNGVRFVGQTQNMPMLYCAADVTVVPTFYDPAGRVVIESIALGTPVIPSVFDGSASLIMLNGQEKCGRVIGDPWSTGFLVDAMAFLTDADQRAARAQACRERAPDLAMGRFMDEIEALLSGSVST